MPVSTDWVVQRRLWRSPSQQSTTPQQFTTATEAYFPRRSYQSWRPSQQSSHTKLKHQVILPQSHPISKLVVQDLALVRQQVWIPQGKSLTRKIVNDCLYCRRRIEPKVPVMEDMPRERLALFEPPFTNTGVDYFGPMNVKKGRSTEERCGCIFTCLTTRAVHLEPTGDLCTDSFIIGL